MAKAQGGKTIFGGGGGGGGGGRNAPPQHPGIVVKGTDVNDAVCENMAGHD